MGCSIAAFGSTSFMAALMYSTNYFMGNSAQLGFSEFGTWAKAASVSAFFGSPKIL
jgi:hypothetical protein